ncbi:DUF4157 domain-containing protein [Paucibacter sp. PLA-PC-4]|uniref:eCIS core domain-containing protein n=1 Tax=Paucibacter sp. PLA-PC-4 TaxID=2993655 RepID=UPI00224AA03A|nr:DUF4157 domain-containing protein [Paucibacter sp. PLA-PC-4]MCX2864884.1 DUF4157 domain-containing protein [Paucibacter sp. PLA-PC-4]
MTAVRTALKPVTAALDMAMPGFAPAAPRARGPARSPSPGWAQDLSAVPLVQRQCSGSAPKARGCHCASCDDEPSEGVQAKPLAPAVEDAHDQAADRAADAVMARRRPGWLGSVSAGPLRRARAQPPGGQASPTATAVEPVLRASGRPLEAPVRHLMESRFGQDFSAVRVHADDRGASAAARLNARAFALGPHLAFGRNEYAPHTPAGQHLLAHELAHVVQQRGLPQVQRMPLRTSCDAPRWDGQAPGCGAGGLKASWTLVDLVTKAAANYALDELVVRRGLASAFPGNWITQVWTPANPEKSGADRGRADGMKVRTGGTLRVEVVEVKSRSTEFAGGCDLAAREAAGYVSVLRPLAPQLLQISQGLAGIGGMRVDPNRRLNATQQFVIESAGISMATERMRQAWRFYQGLQDKLNTTFTTPFTAFEAAVHAEGARGKVYPAGPEVLEECKTGRGRSSRPGRRRVQLGFQVNLEGGASYGCSKTPCQGEEEEEQRQRQAVPLALPRAQPEALPETEVTGVRQPQPAIPPPSEEDDLTIPVLVGTGAAAALTAAAVARAQQRALQIAGERTLALAADKAAQRVAIKAAKQAAAKNVISLAERRAAKAAGTKVAGRVAGAAAARAVAAASAAAAVFLLASGRAEARVGLGPDPLSALYDALTRNGTPPTDEMRALIESDPTLRALAQEAGPSGNMTPLQQALAQRTMELIRDNASEFSEEDLEILSQMSSSGAAGASPQTGADLCAAIDAARADQSGTGKGAGTGSSTSPGKAAGQGSGSVPGAGPSTSPTTATPAGTNGGGTSDPQAKAVGDARRAYPALSDEARGQVAAAPPAVRRLFDAMTGRGPGPAVDDAVVRRFFEIVPLDLDDAGVSALIAGLGPTGAGRTAEEILARLDAAVRARGTRPSPEVPPPPSERPPPQTGEGGTETPGAAATAGPTAAGEKASPERSASEEDAVRLRSIELLVAAIKAYDGWASLGPSQYVMVGNLSGVPVGGTVGLHVYQRSPLPDGSSVRAACWAQLRVTQAATRTGQRWRGTVVSSTFFVSENGDTVDGLPAGRVLSGILQ